MAENGRFARSDAAIASMLASFVQETAKRDEEEDTVLRSSLWATCAPREATRGFGFIPLARADVDQAEDVVQEVFRRCATRRGRYTPPPRPPDDPCDCCWPQLAVRLLADKSAWLNATWTRATSRDAVRLTARRSQHEKVNEKNSRCYLDKGKEVSQNRRTRTEEVPLCAG